MKEIVYMLNKQFVEICELKKYIKEKEAVKNRKHENKDCVDWASLLPFDDVDKMDTFCKKLEKKENYVDSMVIFFYHKVFSFMFLTLKSQTLFPGKSVL